MLWNGAVEVWDELVKPQKQFLDYKANTTWEDNDNMLKVIKNENQELLSLVKQISENHNAETEIRDCITANDVT